MTSLIDLISSSLTDAHVESIGSELQESPERTKAAIDQALPVLVGSLASRGARGASGWALLSGFLDKNQDGSIMDDLIGLALGTSAAGAGGSTVGGPASPANAEALRQILGDRQPAAAEHLEKSSGLDSGTIMRLLTMLAPIVIGGLAKVQKTQGLDQGSLTQFLEKERVELAAAPAGQNDFLAAMFDADGDGSVVDDLAEKGAGILGRLFR